MHVEIIIEIHIFLFATLRIYITFLAGEVSSC